MKKQEPIPVKQSRLISNIILLILLVGLGYLLYQKYFVEQEETNQINLYQNANQEINAPANQNYSVNENQNQSVVANRNQPLNQNQNTNSGGNSNQNQNTNISIDPGQYHATVPGWSIYVNTKKYFAIEYPSSWQSLEKPSGVYLGTGNLDRTPPEDIIKVLTYTNSNQLPLDQWLETARPSDPDAASIRSDINLNGLPAYYIKSDYQSQELLGAIYNYYQEAAVVAKGDKVYEISCLTKNEQSSALDIFRQAYPTFLILF